METPKFRLFLDTRNSEATGLAILSLGNEPGGQIVATLPYRTELDTIRARMFKLLPEAYDQIAEFEQLWWYHGPCEVECPVCKSQGKETKISVPGCDDAQVGRITRLKLKIFA